jgi:hypothetical protein
VRARVEPVDDRVHDSGRAVHDVERRVEPMVARLAGGNGRRVFVGHPAGVHAVHVDAVVMVVGGRRARHHVERGLGHVGVRMARGLEPPVELPFDSRHVDDVLVAPWRPQHQRLEPGIEHEGRHRIDQVHLEQLHRGHLGQEQPPRVAVAQVHLLEILVELPLGEQRLLRLALVGQQRDLRELGGARQPGHVGKVARQRPADACARLGQQVIATESLVGTHHVADPGRQPVERSGLARHHVRVEVGRPPHGLAGVVDDEVEPGARLEQVMTEGLHAR